MKLYSQKRKNLIKILVSAVLLIVLLFLLNFFNHEVKNFFYLISSPVQKLFWQTSTNFSGKEVSELRQKNQELLAQLSLLEQLQKENEQLRGALNLDLQKDFKLVFSQIISKDASEDSILIDKGGEDGISENMPVIDQQKALFGKISEVYKNFSRVSLISGKDFASDVKIQPARSATDVAGGNKDILGVAKGRGNFSLYLDLVPKDAEIREGDVLVTSNLEGRFPKDLLVGVIDKVIKEDPKPFQTAGIKPFFDLTVVDNLFVITNFKK